MTLQKNDPAPDCGFDISGGGRKSVADYRGAPLVIYFYPRDDTPGCTKEAQGFSALADDFAQAGVAVVGISKDSVAKHDKFAVKYDLKIALGSDGDGSVCEAFGVWVEKLLYGRQYMGIERATFLIGSDGTVLQVWHKVKVAGHAEAVLAAVRGV
ncbi:peroxiredoxin [Sphingomonas sp.]|uniref:peroxiredoxin n=1 Tax=Sphingomonas sp. TaxID=28214 RepID=UPI0025CF992B|nr:peroxiredoxin [Sphingomonas sp.]